MGSGRRNRRRGPWRKGYREDSPRGSRCPHESAGTARCSNRSRPPIDTEARSRRSCSGLGQCPRSCPSNKRPLGHRRWGRSDQRCRGRRSSPTDKAPGPHSRRAHSLARTPRCSRSRVRRRNYKASDRCPDHNSSAGRNQGRTHCPQDRPRHSRSSCSCRWFDRCIAPRSRCPRPGHRRAGRPRRFRLQHNRTDSDIDPGSTRCLADTVIRRRRSCWNRTRSACRSRRSTASAWSLQGSCRQDRHSGSRSLLPRSDWSWSRMRCRLGTGCNPPGRRRTRKRSADSSIRPDRSPHNCRSWPSRKRDRGTSHHSTRQSGRRRGGTGNCPLRNRRRGAGHTFRAMETTIRRRHRESRPHKIDHRPHSSPGRRRRRCTYPRSRSPTRVRNPSRAARILDPAARRCRIPTGRNCRCLCRSAPSRQDMGRQFRSPG